MSSLSEACILDWNVDRMLQWLREENLHDCVAPFSFKKISGLTFLNLSDCDIKALRISQESKRKLTKVLKRIKAKRTAVAKRFSGEMSANKERRKPPAVPVHVDHDDDSDHDGWCTDEFSDNSDDEHEDEEFSGSDSGGDYIEPEDGEIADPPQGSPSKEVPNVPLGLVAQLKAGLSGSIRRNPWQGPPANPHTKTTPLPFEDDEEQIYDEPPDGEEDGEEFYEQPSDDSGSAIVVHPLPMSHKKIIRCPSDKGEYIEPRAPQYSDKTDAAIPAPPRPAKPGSLKTKKVQPQPPPIDQELYDEVPEDDQLGRTQIVEPEQETYEVPDDGAQNNATPQQEMETYEVPDQPDEPEPETYEVPEEPAPARPPPRRQPAGPAGLKPPLKTIIPPQPADKLKTPPAPKEVIKPKPAVKPMMTPKPQISPKPSPPGPAATPKRTSRLYPSPKDNTGPPEPPPTKRSPGLPSPGSRPLIPPPSQESSTKSEKNNNEIPKNTPSPRIQPPVGGRRPVPTPVEESPPPPPRPAGIKHPPLKPPRLSDSDNQDNSPHLPGRPLPLVKQGSPLPAPPAEHKTVDPLKQFPWFLGPLDKKKAETALSSFSKQGAFIVRNSSKDANNYSMSLYYKGSVKHLRMPRVNNKFVLGDSGKVPFSTIPELVDYYSQHQVELKSGGSTSLTAACPVKL